MILSSISQFLIVSHCLLLVTEDLNHLSCNSLVVAEKLAQVSLESVNFGHLRISVKSDFLMGLMMNCSYVASKFEIVIPISVIHFTLVLKIHVVIHGS